MELKLYSSIGSNSSERVEWVLNYKAIPYQRIEVNNEELVSSYLHINPFGYVPCLGVEGHMISESMAIIECIEELFPQQSLLGHSVFERAAVREICEYVNSSIHSPQNRTVLRAFNPDLSEQAKRELRGQWISGCLAKLKQKLCKDSPFAIGKGFTIADIFVATIYKKALQHGSSGNDFYDAHLVWLRQNDRIQAAEPSMDKQNL
ncbi:glutathione S-transferase family protein [Gynuella sunshinyii]|uniref:Glutathione S-transferase n=1 Tax=Gynuella sunshinyii YC6258 TaxID=1445510 RepID=A0A0C5VSP4_9GAMM|nr:glutathione S-transferase N-terminal domain-containing protein [Gynuella sunshinyii]AJQ97221.1 glutathione S-transferase [Gynuella sunshinyii YC6258]